MIYIGADHRGYEKKVQLLEYFRKNGILVQDSGAYVFSENDDFNDPAIAVAKSVREHPDNFGILICGSAHGMIMQANRFKGIRAITATEPKLVKLSREHNNANILCLSADFLNLSEMEKLIKVFLTTKFKDEEKYIRRINRLDERGDYA